MGMWWNFAMLWDVKEICTESREVFPCSEKGRVCPLLSASGHRGWGNHMGLELWETSWHLEGSHTRGWLSRRKGIVWSKEMLICQINHPGNQPYALCTQAPLCQGIKFLLIVPFWIAVTSLSCCWKNAKRHTSFLFLKSSKLILIVGLPPRSGTLLHQMLRACILYTSGLGSNVIFSERLSVNYPIEASFPVTMFSS